jgi:transposase
MPAPTPLPLRQAILRRHRRGEMATTIAQALGLRPPTVRKLLRRWRHHADGGLAPAYQASDRPRSPDAQRLHDHALALRREHPTWGAGLIRVFLGRHDPPAQVPAERTFQRWFHQAGLGPAPKGRRPALHLDRATQPHAVWQVDAKERVRLLSGERVSWLRIVDECSGAVLWTAVFPLREVVDGPGCGGAGRTAAGLRPLGSASHDPGRQRRSLGIGGDWPPDLALWLIGLGIDLHWNDPHTPPQNGIVERSQGTGKRWAEPERCATAAERQQRLQAMDVIQREAYPSIDGQSRAAAFPDLKHSGRPYRAAWERRHWDHRRVLAHLAGYVVPRRVDKNGDVSLDHRPR